MERMHARSDVYSRREHYLKELESLEKRIGNRQTPMLRGNVRYIADGVYKNILDSIDEEIDNLLNYSLGGGIVSVPLGKFEDNSAVLSVGAVLMKNARIINEKLKLSAANLDEKIKSGEKHVVLRKGKFSIQYNINIHLPIDDRWYAVLGVNRIDTEESIVHLNLNGVFNDENDIPSYRYCLNHIDVLSRMRKIKLFPRPPHHYITTEEFLEMSQSL